MLQELLSQLKSNPIIAPSDGRLHPNAVPRGRPMFGKTTAPFIWMNSDWNKSTLPTTKEELLRSGALHEHEEEGSFKMESFEEFFKNQPEELQQITMVFDSFSKPESRRVYLVGDETFFVLLLAVLQDPDRPKRFSLVGLKSLIDN